MCVGEISLCFPLGEWSRFLSDSHLSRAVVEKLKLFLLCQILPPPLLLLLFLDYEKLCTRKFESIDFYVQISGGDLPDFNMDGDNYVTMPAGLVYFLFKPCEKYIGSRISKEDRTDKDRKKPQNRKDDRSLIPSRNNNRK